jgi:hypothetical protein
VREDDGEVEAVFDLLDGVPVDDCGRREDDEVVVSHLLRLCRRVG